MKLATFEVSTAVGPVRRLAVVEGGGDGSDGVSGDGDDVAYLDVTAGYARLLDDDGEPRPTEVAETLAPASMTEFLRGATAVWTQPGRSPTRPTRSTRPTRRPR